MRDITGGKAKQAKQHRRFLYAARADCAALRQKISAFQAFSVGLLPELCASAFICHVDFLRDRSVACGMLHGKARQIDVLSRFRRFGLQNSRSAHSIDFKIAKCCDENFPAYRSALQEKNIPIRNDAVAIYKRTGLAQIPGNRVYHLFGCIPVGHEIRGPVRQCKKQRHYTITSRFRMLFLSRAEMFGI